MSPISRRLTAIATIIRKDLQLLWPLALAIFVLQLGLTLFVHEVTEFPGAILPTDRAFLNPFINPANPIAWVGVALPPILSAIFIVLAVQGEAVTDRRHDWLTRPIGALEVALAKIALVLGVVFVPFALGTIIFTLTTQNDPQLTMLPVAIMLRNCLFGVLLAWLVSSLLEAALAFVGLMTLTGVMTAIVTAIGMAVYVAARTHLGVQEGAAPAAETPVTAWPRILIQLAIQIAMMWPVLWLLLRRRIMSARLIFAAAYIVASAIPFSQLRKPASGRAAVIAPIIHLTPYEEVRYA
jgi:hypothetical protein